MAYCCGPCSFLWVLHRRGYWIDQEEIAWFCKLNIPQKKAKRFVRKMRITKSTGDEGISSAKLDIYLNRMLQKKKIPLKVERYPISKIENPKELIIENLKAGNDIMLAFSCKQFPKFKSIIGHICVVAEFDSNKGIITLGDPAGSEPKFWQADLKKIVKAMDKKYDGNERGFWIISPKK